MVSLACSKMKPTTIRQAAIYLALKIDNDERNEEALKIFRWKQFYHPQKQQPKDIIHSI